MAEVDSGKGASASKGSLSQFSDKLGPVSGSDDNVPGSSLSDFELVSELGRGTYGVVHKVRSKKDGKIYCLKRVKCGHMSTQRQREVLMEVLMLRRLNHKHVIGYYTSFVEKKSLYIVMEFASNGDLQRVLDEHKRNKTYVPEKMLWYVACFASLPACGSPHHLSTSCRPALRQRQAPASRHMQENSV